MKRLLPLLLLVSACGKPPVADGQASAKRYPVEVATAVSEAAARSVTAPASVEARETARIAARVSGIVARVLVQEGDTVLPGSLVAELDPARARLDADAARAGLARAQAVADEAQASERRRRDAAQAQPGLISADELAQLAARSAQAAADVDAARTHLARAELDLADNRITSPIAGIVQARLAATGDAVQPGSPIASIIDRSRILVRTHVPAADAALLKPGQVGTAVIDHQQVAIQVTLVADTADPASRLVGVLAQVADADAVRVRPGAFAQVRFDLPPGEPRVLVPDLAVRPSSRGYLVYRVDDQVARELTVQVGSRTRDGRIEVLTGLSAGDTVVARGAEALRDGAALDIAKP